MSQQVGQRQFWRVAAALIVTALAAGAGYQLAGRYLDDDTADQVDAIAEQTARIAEAQETADRIGLSSACQSEYASTAEAHASAVRDLAAQLGTVDRTSPRFVHLVARAGLESTEGLEVTLRRLGVARLARQATLAGDEFECPPLPRRLRVRALDPLDPRPTLEQFGGG